MTYNTFDRIPATIPIAADYVRCLGSENTTRRCTYFSHSFSGCSHDDDIGIICPPGKSSKGTPQLMLLFFPLQQIVMMEMSDCLMEEMDMCLLASKIGGVLYVINIEISGWLLRLYAVSLDILVVSRFATQVWFSYAVCTGDAYQQHRTSQQISMPLQNLTLHCHGHESRIFDCTHSPSRPNTCSYFLNVACEPGKINFTHSYCLCLYCFKVYVTFSVKNNSIVYTVFDLNEA